MNCPSRDLNIPATHSDRFLTLQCGIMISWSKNHKLAGGKVAERQPESGIGNHHLMEIRTPSLRLVIRKNKDISFHELVFLSYRIISLSRMTFNRNKRGFLVDLVVSWSIFIIIVCTLGGCRWMNSIRLLCSSLLK